MAKVFIEETTLSAIGDAIRTKTETTELINPADMAEKIEGITTGGNTAELTITSNGTYTAPEGIDGYTPITVNVPQDGSPPAEAFVITGDCSYRFANDGWNWFINTYSNQITTENIESARNMFEYSEIEEIPFDINCNPVLQLSFSSMFAYCNDLITCPKITGMPSMMDNMFVRCSCLKEIPESLNTTIDWSLIDNYTSGYNGKMSALFNQCYALRKIPECFLKHTNRYFNYSYYLLYRGFQKCYVLEELSDVAVPYNATWTSNAFYDTFEECSRLKRFTFETNEDGTPFIVNWKSQVIDLSDYVGYATYASTITSKKTGGNFTTGVQIIDDATYQEYKNNENSWTIDINYSRYNKTSAIETINSLPDTSAYLAEKGGTNTIKFKGASGALTDGGAINTMTEEEIAVATAKGWTVSFV